MPSVRETGVVVSVSTDVPITKRKSLSAKNAMLTRDSCVMVMIHQSTSGLYALSPE